MLLVYRLSIIMTNPRLPPLTGRQTALFIRVHLPSRNRLQPISVDPRLLNDFSSLCACPFAPMPVVRQQRFDAHTQIVLVDHLPGPVKKLPGQV